MRIPSDIELAQIIENQVGRKVKLVGKDDSIAVRLHSTSHSCSNSALVLSPYEMFSICDKLNMSSNDFIEKYCNISVMDGSGMPTMIIGTGTKCCFSKGSKCTLEECKPLSCALYPLSRVKCYSPEGTVGFKHFMLDSYQCIGEVITVEEWLKKNNIHLKDEGIENFHRLLYVVISKFSFSNLKNTDKLEEDLKIQIVAGFMTLAYGNYEPGTDMDLDTRYEDMGKMIDELLSEMDYLSVK